METTIYRTCSFCGIQAKSLNELKIFVRDVYKPKFYNTKNVCKRCHRIISKSNRMGPKHGPNLLGRCKSCNLIPLSYSQLDNNFVKDKTMKSGYSNLCKECNKKRVVIHNRENPDILKKRSRRRLLKGNYNITLDMYEKLLKSQNYSCAICKRHESMFLKSLHIDHDHSCCNGKKSCGKCIRGLLCQNCNAALGNFKDSKKNLRDAIIYLGGD